MGSRLLRILAVICLCGSTPVLASDRAPQGTAAEALRIARESQAQWKIGRVTVRQKWLGASRGRAELVFNGRVVARLRVDPATGAFLAEDERPKVPGQPLDSTALRAAVERSLHGLEIADWTWPTEHGRAWGVPLRYGGRVVGSIKVDTQRGPLAREDEDD